ncbi:hypothetical protein ACFDTO_27785 [Microbacteriaceae bacterium 4G12]
MKYEMFSTIGDKITEFESEWHFREQEQIFLQFTSEKRNFIITHITHDLYANKDHIIRLYCQEKKVY